MLQRLQKILAARGICSRRKAEEMITAGRVSVNGAVANLGDSADPETDEIRLDGDLLPTASDFVYILLHKPRGFSWWMFRNEFTLLADWIWTPRACFF